MPELRVDPLSGHKTIVAGERSRRPGGAPTCAPAEPIDVERDPFAEGHEDRTPPELYAARPGGGPPDSPGWTVRVVPNLYPALTPDPPPADPRAGGTPAIPSDTGPDSPSERLPTHTGADSPSERLPTHTGADSPSERLPTHTGADSPSERLPTHTGADSPSELFLATPAVGAHEVIVNGPQSVLSLAELPREQVVAAVEVWRERMRAHAASACAQLIVNERREAGASLPHTHAQLYALDFVPADVARERERAGAHATRTMGHDLLEDLVAEEVRRGERIVAIDDEAVLLAPYASRVPFQLMLAPRRPRARFEDEGPTGAALLHEGLQRLARHLGASPPLNLWVRTAPRGAERFCWRIDVMPRLTHLAGLELSTGVNLNIVAPEDAAAALRDA